MPGRPRLTALATLLVAVQVTALTDFFRRGGHGMHWGTVLIPGFMLGAMHLGVLAHTFYRCPIPDPDASVMFSSRAVALVHTGQVRLMVYIALGLVLALVLAGLTARAGPDARTLGDVCVPLAVAAWFELCVVSYRLYHAPPAHASPSEVPAEDTTLFTVDGEGVT